MDSEKLGSLFYFGERILLGCRGLVTESHSHYAVSLLLTQRNTFQILERNGIPYECDAILIAPNHYHALLAENSDMIVLQFDPKSSDYKSIKNSLGKERTRRFKRDLFLDLIPQLDQLLAGNMDCSQANTLYYNILNRFGMENSQELEQNERMKSALKLIESRLPEPIGVSDLALQIGISEDRFMHWFKEQFGIPLRQYLLWKRLHIAARLLQTGTNLTDASHAAGFSDQSHLSKTFKKMFGVPPSRFLGRSENFRVCFCTKF
ncbi:AraC family transcriptional regulator [Leptospira ognonensis]|uniref:AraC family transcriptional regulator n=1 Tax=Leptospira ognonensis TaxID=2484945 RepID=A0A4R9KCR0_9LEPT|nr:AraC family transcriptional regulator [Leptospira ognonensis]TGL63886.1 AraC family transcriptional regulator [Leptospira ognonensis]